MVYRTVKAIETMTVPHMPLKLLLDPCCDTGEIVDVLLRLEKSAASLGLPPPPELGGERRQGLMRLVQSLQDEFNARQDEFVALGYGARVGPSLLDVIARALPMWYAEAAWTLERKPLPWWQFWKR